MIRSIRLFAVAVALFLSGTAFTFVTLNQTYVWNHYKMQITVPDDFKVVRNSDENFEMKGDGMELFMDVFEKDITKDDMDEATVAGAKAMKLNEIDAAHELATNGLEGYYVEGEKDGDRVMFAGLIDPGSHTNFFVAITFDDEDKTAEADALRIMMSLRKIN